MGLLDIVKLEKKIVNKIYVIFLNVKNKNIVKILLKIGDEVELWNGTKGKIIYLDKENYEINISLFKSYSEWFHKMNIKLLNNKEVDVESLII